MIALALSVSIHAGDCGTWGNQARMFAIARVREIPIETARQKNEQALSGAMTMKDSVIRSQRDADHARDLLELAYETKESPDEFGKREYDACTKKLGIES